MTCASCASAVTDFLPTTGPAGAARQTVSVVSSSSGVQEVGITMKGGYSPGIIEVERGKLVRLHFYRDEENSCSEELLMLDFSIRRDLPAFQTTLVELLSK